MGFWRFIKRSRNKDEDGDRLIREVLNALSTAAQIMADWIRSSYPRYIDLFKAVFGFETQEFEFPSTFSQMVSSIIESGNFSDILSEISEIYNELSRTFFIESSITEPDYSPDNYLVRAFNEFFNIDENSYPIAITGTIACTVGSESLVSSREVSTIVSEITGVPVLLVDDGVAGVINDKDMGQVTCGKKASIKFSGEVPREVNADAADLFRAVVDVMNNVRGRFSNLRNDFVNTYGFEPANIRLGGGVVMLDTSFDLSISSEIRDYIQRLFAGVVPNKETVKLSLGIMCGVPPGPAISYDDAEGTLTIGYPHKVSSGDCMKYSIIKYM